MIFHPYLKHSVEIYEYLHTSSIFLSWGSSGYTSQFDKNQESPAKKFPSIHYRMKLSHLRYSKQMLMQLWIFVVKICLCFANIISASSQKIHALSHLLSLRYHLVMPFSCLIGVNPVALLFLSIVISVIYPQKCHAVDYMEMIITPNEKVY